MSKISRSEFLRNSLKVGALAVVSQAVPLAGAWGNNLNGNAAIDEELLKRISAANDSYVEDLLKSGKPGYGRKLAHDFSCLAAAYTYAGSKFHHDASLISLLDKSLDVFIEDQSEDGTLNFGNLESPPDTGFLIEVFTVGAILLLKENSPATAALNNKTKNFILKAGDALTVGGVHTANHRFVICAALSRINALYPNKKYITRIEDWLGEGIYNDADGHFPERSQNYDQVEDNSLITIARLLNRPELFEPVRKNLDMTYYYMEPNGDLVVNDSRRQDQWSGKRMSAFYLHYRYMANRDASGKYAAIAKLIEAMDDFENDVVRRAFYHFLEEPLLQQQLPAPAVPSVNFEKLFATSSLLRIRRDKITSTLFGGSDLPLIVASGRSSSPNFFAYRKGDAILKYLRLSSAFFSTGYFYSEGLKKNGNEYTLYRKLDVPYYQPLPKNLRNAKGDYKLSPSIDDRFWNKMDFSNRPVSNVKSLITKISLFEKNGINELTFDISGSKDVLVTIELCFKEGGKLSGLTAADNGNNFLESGMGTYEFGGDTIQFGPGANAHKIISELEGERYRYQFGSLRTEGMHVFITGKTPFTHKLTFG
jgi:hypothetical protein